MSIGALVMRPPGAAAGGPGDYLPVATEAEFGRYWLAVTQCGSFPTVDQFALGVSIAPEQIDSVLEELDKFAARAQDTVLPRAVAERMLQRVTILREFLGGLDPAQVKEVYVG